VRILRPETIEDMTRNQIGDLAPERWRAAGRAWGYGAAVYTTPGPDGSPALEKYGWVGGGFAKLWVEPAKRLVAYFNVPLSPPGDYDLLDEFEARVDAATAANW